MGRRRIFYGRFHCWSDGGTILLTVRCSNILGASSAGAIGIQRVPIVVIDLGLSSIRPRDLSLARLHSYCCCCCGFREV